MGAERKKQWSRSSGEGLGKEGEEEMEVVKAVAQAWHAQASIAGTTKLECEAQKNRFKQRPSRFRVEAAAAMNMNMNMLACNKEAAESHWDFGKSLWDSYEIVTLSKKLEASLSVDDPVVALAEVGRRWKRRRESSNSLRNLFHKITSSSSSSSSSSSKRFDADFAMFDEA